MLINAALWDEGSSHYFTAFTYGPPEELLPSLVALLEGRHP